MSVFWIVMLSFALVTVVGRTGCILGVDNYTMGLVVVAIGTSVPVSNSTQIKYPRVKLTSSLRQVDAKEYGRR
jgi:hypothetical protein